jgi:hypothetical protein
MKKAQCGKLRIGNGFPSPEDHDEDEEATALPDVDAILSFLFWNLRLPDKLKLYKFVRIMLRVKQRP